MSVVEYLTDTTCSFTALAWVLKPKEELIVQTLSKYDYVSFIAISLHAGSINGYYLTFLERAVDVFQTCFRSNTRNAMTGSLDAVRLG